jgi:serpin B
MMSATIDKLPYYEDEYLQAIELPYSGKRMAMLVLLPRDSGSGATELTAQLDLLSELRAKLKPEPVIVNLPRFSFSQRQELKDELSALSLSSMFTSLANLKGMSPVDGLYVSNFVHEARIDVDETGTEAAAASGVQVGTWSSDSSGGARYFYFVADHPFVFVILDRKTGLNLFVGRVMNPTVT